MFVGELQASRPSTQAHRNDLSEAKCDDCFSNSDVDDVYTKWTQRFLATTKACVPHRILTVRSNDLPWYTNKLKIHEKMNGDIVS